MNWKNIVDVILGVLEKIGQVLGSARFWLAVLTILPVVAGMFAIDVSKVEKWIGPDGAAAAEFFKNIVAAVIYLVVSVATIIGYSVREPSSVRKSSRAFPQETFTESVKQATKEYLRETVQKQK